MDELSTLVDLLRKAETLTGPYENMVLAQINDHVIRISLMTEPYYWHQHPDSEETFIGLEGTVAIDLDNRRIELNPGQLFTVPKGANHRTAPVGARSINLTIERANMTTLPADAPAA